MDDVVDETSSVVIVGGGPHALAALSALHEGSLAFQQFGDDRMYEARVGFGSLEKVGSGEYCPPHEPIQHRKLISICACRLFLQSA